MTTERLGEIEKLCKSNEANTSTCEIIRELIGAVRTLTQSLAEVTGALSKSIIHNKENRDLAVNLQSQLTASHAENARLRDALELARHIYIKRFAKNVDELKSMAAPFDEALTPTTPNPVLEELKELRAFKQLYQGGTVGSDVIRLAASKEAKV